MAGLLIVFLTYLHFFLEWVFYITKPSFLAGLDFSQSLGILFITPLPVILLELVLLAIVNSPLIPHDYRNGWPQNLIVTGVIGVVLLLAATKLLSVFG